jgi:nucleotide sugar dehydrogenase
MNKIGIIGLGFVGNAIYRSIEPYSYGQGALVILDPVKGHNTSYEELYECEGIFVCVPSPMKADGSCDTSILESVLLNLKNYKGVIISKVTAPPDVYQRLNDQYPNLVHAPEFLTAANAVRDYANGTFAIIGGRVKAYRDAAEMIIRLSQRNLETVKFCSIGEAALAKYAINSFLATKVIFMNELYNLANKAGLNYDVVSNLIKQDQRIGSSHMMVPGPDGQLGFGGACFPKDTEALVNYAKSVSVDLSVLITATQKNTMLRLTKPK